jgi:DNA modification methylase
VNKSEQDFTLYHGDCLEVMRGMEDGSIDAVIADPPYGIGEDWKKRKHSASKFDSSYNNKSVPGAEYFDQIRRIAKYWIIWGWNYYTEMLPPTNYLICWDKLASEKISFYSMGELAGSNIKIPFRIFRVPWDGGRKGDETGTTKYHPHQKPVKLLCMCVDHLPDDVDTILDPFMGSGTTGVACMETGRKFIGIELDKGYYDIAEKRIIEATRQQRLFT